MRVELITIGEELLLGFTLDANGAFLSRELAGLGIIVGRRVTVGDNPDDITAAVAEALNRAEGVITTGGLGPTTDDVTKPAVAAAFGRRLRRDDSVVAGLETMWRARGRSGALPAANLAQAIIPEGARILPNAHGTAPGVWIERDDGKWAAMLPGVPREMRAMYSDALRPLLTQRTRQTTVVRSLTLRTTGVAESQLPDLLEEMASGLPGVGLAYLPTLDGVDLRLTVRGHPPAESDNLLRTAGAELHVRLGAFAYAQGDTDLADVVIEACRSRRLTLAVAESCTGGMLGSRLTRVPGASEVFWGGVVAYDNAAKTEALGVPANLIEEHGAVSEPVALAMAVGIRVRADTDLALSITGVAGPTGGTQGKPVGTVWIGITDRAAGSARHVRFFGDRHEIRYRATQMALDMLRRTMMG